MNISLLKKVKFLLGEEKNKFPLFILLFLLTSSLEFFGIGLIGAYITILIDKNTAIEYLSRLNTNYIDQFISDNIVIKISIILLIIFIIKTFTQLFLHWAIVTFGLKQQIRLRNLLMQSFLNLEYEHYLLKNSSEYVYCVNRLTYEFGSFIQILLKLISDLLLVLVLFILLFYADSNLLFIILLVVGLFYLLYRVLFTKLIVRYGEVVNEKEQIIIRLITEAFSGIKELRILQKEKYFTSQLDINSSVVVNNQIKSSLITTSPRIILELLVIAILVVHVVIMIKYYGSITSNIPAYSVFGIAGLRIIPAVSNITNIFFQINYQIDGINILYNDLFESKTKKHIDEIPKYIDASDSFQNIQFKSIMYKYPNTNNLILNNVNLEITKGQHIGIIGSTGSGKSTLINVLLQLLKANEGEVYINKKKVNDSSNKWSNSIGYLPQDVFILDDSILNNIVLNSLEYDLALFNKCIKQASLDKLISDLPDTYNTIIGEKGARISGGQKQRIAIARSLYHKKEILVFDEATNALDSETENEIMREIYNLQDNMTIIIVAHNLATIKSCDVVYKLEDGYLSKINHNNI